MIGNRPLPSCLGGGDLDGDPYNIIPLRDHPRFTPERTYEPAEYEPSEKQLTTWPCTMKDVADFVMQYIVSDVGLVVAAISSMTYANRKLGDWCRRNKLAYHRRPKGQHH
jgi:hypothetical protein